VNQYAAAFDLYFRLSAKRGNTHSQFNKSILFLKGITARNLMKIVEPLIIAIESMQGNNNAGDGGLPIGYLPYHLRVDELTQKIADRCKVEPFDRDLDSRPRVHNLTFGGAPSHPTSDLDDEQYAEPIDGHMQGYNVPTVAQACKPNGQPGRRMPNTTYLALRPGQKLVTSSSDFTPASIVASPLPPPQPPLDSPLFHPTVCFHPTVETETVFRFQPSTNVTPPSCLRAVVPDTFIDTAIISTVNELPPPDPPPCAAPLPLPVTHIIPLADNMPDASSPVETHPDIFLCPQRTTYWA